MNRLEVAGPVCVICVSAMWMTACGGASGDVRYPRREAGCPVKSYPGPAPLAVDDLGPVRVECPSGTSCERQLLDAVCARGGDVAWGTADNALSATVLVAQAAHTKLATQGPRERGCAVIPFTDAPNVPTENIGSVTALCNDEDSRDVCMRELSDQVCLLGGDVVWAVEGPTHVDTQNGSRQRMRGRAAHTK
jgi:hypothetical protein